MPAFLSRRAASSRCAKCAIIWHVLGRRLRALCGALEAPGRDEIGELDSEIERLMRSIASPTAGLEARAASRVL